MTPVTTQAMAAVRRTLSAPLLYAALAAVLVSGILLPHIGYSLDLPIEEIDEAAVYFSTGYYDLAFVRHDLRAPEWQARDAYDHPPGWKYLYGAILHATGHPRGSLADKERWFWLGWGRPGLTPFIDQRAPTAVLLPMRVAAAVFVGLALGLLFALVTRLAAPPTALLAVVLAALHPVVRIISARAVIDPLLLLMVLVATWATARWLRAGARPGPAGWAWALGLGAILAFLSNTKITGFAAVCGVALAAGLQLSASRDWRGSAARVGGQLVLIGVSALVLAIAIDPTLWRDPIGGLRAMVDYRLEALQTQMRVFSGAQHSLLGGLGRFGYELVLAPDPLWRAARVPLVALLSVVGLLRFVRRADRRSPWVCAFAGNAAFWVVVSAATYRMDWLRYIVPAVPFVAFLAAYGCAGVSRAAVRRAGKWLERHRTGRNRRVTTSPARA